MTQNSLKTVKKFFVLLLISNICSQVVCEESSPLSNLVVSALNNYVDHLKTNRKLDSNSAVEPLPETRGGGGYGHGGGGGYGHGGGGHGYGAITLDPVSIISLLALGAFLINNILQLLRANQPAAPAPAPAPAPGKRSFDEINIPEEGSAFRSDDQSDKPFKDRDESEPSFSKFFENVGSLYYLQPKKRNICIKKVVCMYVNAQSSREERHTIKTRIFDFMLSAITRFVAPELNAESIREDTCGKFNKLCSDSLLHDAKISVENKVYAEVSSLISTLAVKQLVG